MSAAFTALILFLCTGALVPVNRQFRQTPDGILVFVASNGTHTDVVLPLHVPHTQGASWFRHFPDSSFHSRFGAYEYAAFGWGSEKFYLASYNQQVPGPATVLRALVPGPTLMHVRFLRHAPPAGTHVVAVRISRAQHQLLTAQIEAAFQSDSLNRYTLRNAAGYTANDFFFRATGRYHALRTCNDWTVRTLRRAGLRVPLKSPLAAPVLHQVRQAK
ncbi:DUF2459 domain-containing protein [Microvirga sp. STR05]|uniref:DUF2459 domain-containing protein n=1 Tax=Hymenobacter duratus TaxID=2771356 RepID=A0ABR8JH00_9BACT|nr:DUF2459 domain-containing protein [Hymenobacter duratus]MBD2714973.1 DUF2459 domain-containing protein [Hymenobacter duratus]MBR7949879.1 DUF2459 domain-containing protein [Microvirga sp. STR05]